MSIPNPSIDSNIFQNVFSVIIFQVFFLIRVIVCLCLPPAPRRGGTVAPDAASVTGTPKRRIVAYVGGIAPGGPPKGFPPETRLTRKNKKPGNKHRSGGKGSG